MGCERFVMFVIDLYQHYIQVVVVEVVIAKVTFSGLFWLQEVNSNLADSNIQPHHA